jgi:hypothetical protein
MEVGQLEQRGVAHRPSEMQVQVRLRQCSYVPSPLSQPATSVDARSRRLAS